LESPIWPQLQEYIWVFLRSVFHLHPTIGDLK
jgi:hypothetical protein